VDWYLEVLKVLNIPRDWDFTWLPAPPEIGSRVRERFGEAGQRIIFVPGARWDNKRWPAEHFAALARRIARRFPEAAITIAGAKGDGDLAAAIRAASRENVQDLTGRTTLPELIELIRTSAAVVTNDTGPMHIAAAARVPVVALFGPTEPRRTGPYGTSALVLREALECVPCMESSCRYREPLACLKTLAPDRVFTALESCMNKGGKGSVRWDD
jgi:lipopolysaccharide heptosyltransferase II